MLEHIASLDLIEALDLVASLPLEGLLALSLISAGVGLWFAQMVVVSRWRR